ncbi:ABC transporter permease [Natronobiforma cellulositropha]|uniref:ABC transporter permease n=1 Tax=Natronobiforma cellulositropha TaxID=1679076 RepID=UPI0021D5F405|nr:ABC transporter permease subunit [Natronobiforma cellulositropha]
MTDADRIRPGVVRTIVVTELRRFKRPWVPLALLVWILVSVWRTVYGAETDGTPEVISSTAYVVRVNPETSDAMYAVFEYLSVWWHVNSIHLLVPLVGLVLGYELIVTERERGRLQTSFLLPARRSTMIVGWYIARGVVLAVVLTVPLVVGWVLITSRFETGDPVAYAIFTVATVGYGLAWLSIGVAVSAAAQSARQAATVVAVLYCYQLVPIHHLIVSGDPLYQLQLLDPRHAYLTVATAPYEHLFPRLHTNVAHDVYNWESTRWRTTFTSEEIPAYLSWPVGVAILLSWIVLPLVYAARNVADTELVSQ